LGSGQTIASQGMIHGGVKYTLSGALSGASEAIADMPEHWRRCMDGEGDVDLRGTRVLSDHFYMWSSGSVASRLTTFLASKALRGRVDALDQTEYPRIFQHKAFKGSLYKLVDTVIDAGSLLETLSKTHSERIFAIDEQTTRLHRQGDGAAVTLQVNGAPLTIHSQLCVLAAGKGNGALLEQLNVASPAMQLRPLQQVMVRHQHPHALYAHCVGTDSKPRLTISSHADGDHTVWYLGGQLAEEGAALAEDVLIERAQQEITELFSWLDWRDAQWATLRVERAEPEQPDLLRPDNAWLKPCENLSRCLVAWPTKLTLTPNLGNLFMDYVTHHIQPQFNESLPAELPRMTTIATSPWMNVQWVRN
jgi:glycerol-3-phosphate dehydrogenase